MRKEEDFRVNI